ncbi:ATP-binding cassette domain-containing protein [Xanthobacter dioxanivorans]|uniref:ATP-binding cassette domain-containing protein n=1 Tax=Xanthobacter dioxanivorans TaxID=2528964 RepID=A0A974PLG6_9HYPH|nr:ATP-binding cassette domain-containing protein [Xanthobacter dioxanivorans]QRG05729.1 ATP-binding cassette domain-containing protein [Xanthobacter dioxanivorans]
MIEIAGVSKSYGTARVLDAVSLSVPAGGLTAIIGPNGAGKSTLLSIVARLLPMDAGRVTVDGLDVSTTTGDVLARRMAILKQDNRITPRLTVSELVAFGRFPHCHGRPTRADAEKVAEAIGYVDLSPLSGRLLDELSGGQRQRAFIAMVLAQDPACLLLDEPLNNLDMKHAAGTMKLLRRAADELGKTVVVVIHDINFAACYADRIVAMKGGRVLVHGGPDDIMRADVLRAIYDMEVAVHEVNGFRLGAYYR